MPLRSTSGTWWSTSWRRSLVEVWSGEQHCTCTELKAWLEQSLNSVPIRISSSGQYLSSSPKQAPGRKQALQAGVEGCSEEMLISFVCWPTKEACCAHASAQSPLLVLTTQHPAYMMSDCGRTRCTKWSKHQLCHSACAMGQVDVGG